MVGFVRRHGDKLIGWLLLLLALLALVNSWKSSHDIQEHAKCQAEWNTFLHRALTSSRNANVEAQAALDQLIAAVSESKSGAETKEALDRYKEARMQQIAVQRDNPLPPPPERVCDI